MVAAGSPEALLTLGSVGHPLCVGVVALADGPRRRIAAFLSVDGITLSERVRTAAELDGAGLDVVIAGSPTTDYDREELRRIRDRCRDARIICVVANPRWKSARALLQDGADGVVALDELEVALVASVRAAHAGMLTLPRRLRREIAQPSLSVREKQILAMVVMGFSNLEISGKLFLAESTVKSHLSSAFGKLGVRSRNEATALILDPATGLGTGILEISGEATRRLGEPTG